MIIITIIVITNKTNNNKNEKTIDTYFEKAARDEAPKHGTYDQ